MKKAALAPAFLLSIMFPVASTAFFRRGREPVD